ncbi:hypothetical protein [Desulfocicer vacuolatum]|nr:hypothetical protein [Desulfocicer vacuolatum]
MSLANPVWYSCLQCLEPGTSGSQAFPQDSSGLIISVVKFLKDSE